MISSIVNRYRIVAWFSETGMGVESDLMLGKRGVTAGIVIEFGASVSAPCSINGGPG